MKKYLVTVATGLLGRAVVTELLAHDAEICFGPAG
jgi:uncharacterized protein YbjT (DUF2867 family)